MALFFAIALGHLSWLSRYPTIRAELGLTIGEMSIYITSLTIGSAVGLICAAPLVRWLQPRRVLAVCLPLAGVAVHCTVATLYSPFPQFALIALACYGAAYSVTDIALVVSGTQLEMTIGAPRMPGFYALYSAGALVALGLGAVCEALRIPPLVHLTATSAMLLLVTLFYLSAIPRPASDKTDSYAGATSGERSGHVFTPRLLVLGLIVTVAALAEGAANNWIPLSMVDDQGLQGSSGVLVLALFVVGTLVTRAFGNRILGRFGNALTLVVSLLAAIVGVLLVAGGTFVVAACAGVFLWGMGIGLVGPIMFSAAAVGDPERAAQRVSAISIMNSQASSSARHSLASLVTRSV